MFQDRRRFQCSLFSNCFPVLVSRSVKLDMDEEEKNYCCLVVLLTRVGVNRLRQYFINSWNAVGTFRPWQDLPYNGKDLLTKFKPLPYEKSKVKSGDSTQWDLSLFVKTLLYSRPPFVTHKSFEKSLICLKETRNMVSHTTNGKIETPNFKKMWSAVCNALMVLGATSADFKKVKQDVKLPFNELTSLMKKCASQDDEILRGLQTIQARLEKLEVGQQEIKEGQQEIRVQMKEGQQEIKEGQQEIRVEIKEGQQEIKEGQQEIKEEIKSGKVWLESQMNEVKHALHTPGNSCQKLSTEEVKQRSEYLKASTKRQTEYQPKIMASHCIANARTDDIFTNLVMQHGRKSLPKGANRREDLSAYSEPSGKPVERCQDIFIAQKKEKYISRNILVTGKAGIGKSVFCQKLVRDWADGVLFQEESGNEAYGFDFVYLLAFRHLYDLVEEKLTLQDILNGCSLLDDNSNVDESLMQYMSKNQDRVLFILDGYDEYAQRERITSDRIEQKYPNNPHSAMPVSALVSKLLKGKIFGNAVVMVTSRPDESNELGGMNFDTLVEIVGFSKQNVKEFISNYFKSNDEVRNDVLKHVLENEDLLSLAHVPMFCFLICWCMEWHLESKSDLDLPITMTELYSEFVDIFELKHHSKSKYRSEQIPEQYQYPDVVKTTLDKLSMLAAETMKNEKLTFKEDDMTSCGLHYEEIEQLKASGLLVSSPGFRTSPSKITHYYCFLHRTLQEYLSAVWYVENNQVPLLDDEMVCRFFAGVCRKNNRKDLITELFKGFEKVKVQGNSIVFSTRFQNDLAVQILQEYGDKEFSAKMIHDNPEYFTSREKDKIVTNSAKLLVFFLDLLNYSYVKYQSRDISKLQLDLLSVQQNELVAIVDLLASPFCPIVSVDTSFPPRGTFDSIEYFLKSLQLTNITDLKIGIHCQDISGCKYLANLKLALEDTKCKIKTLTFDFWGTPNRRLTDNQASQKDKLLEEFNNISTGIKVGWGINPIMMNFQLNGLH